MFYHVSAAWKRSDLTSPIQQVVLLFIADKADDDGMMRWSVPRIAEACRISEKTARTTLKELYDLGIIGSVEEPRAGAVTHWLVSTNPDFLFKTPVTITRVKRRGRKSTPVNTSGNPGKCDRATPVNTSETPVVITDKAVKKQPVEAVKKQSPAAADAAPSVPEEAAKSNRPRKDGTVPLEDAASEQARAAWFADLREQFTALARHEYSGAAAVIRAACRQYGPDAYACWSALVATSNGDYIGPHLVAKNIGGWKAAGKPSSYALWGRKNGASNDRGTNGISATSGPAQGTNKYREARLLEDAIAERSRSQRRTVPA